MAASVVTKNSETIKQTIFHELTNEFCQNMCHTDVFIEFLNAQTRCDTFSREATIPRFDLSDFSISILGYSQNRLFSFDCIENEDVSLQFLIRWSKLNHISHIKWFENPVYELIADFIHFVSCKTKF